MLVKVAPDVFIEIYADIFRYLFRTFNSPLNTALLTFQGQVPHICITRNFVICVPADVQ